MNITKFMIFWLSIFLFPNLGNTFTVHLSDNTFFTKKIASLREGLYHAEKLVGRNFSKTSSFGVSSHFSVEANCPYLSSVTNATPTHRTIADGNWNSASTWQGGNIPSGNLSGSVVSINHNILRSNEISIGSGTLNVSGVLTIPNDNIVLNNSSGNLNIDHGVILLEDGNIELFNGTVVLNYGGIQLCNGNYTDNSLGGTSGNGYIYSADGNIEDNRNGNFSVDIAWCALGNGVGLPTSENCGIAQPPGGCNDINFYKTFCPSTPPPVVTKSLSGKVYLDNNEDGLNNDGGGNGINGVTVYFYDDVNQDGVVSTEDVLIGTTNTNANGEYNYTINEDLAIEIATDDFSDATWDGTTWRGGTGWSGGWNDSYGESGGNLGPNLGTNGGGGWNVGVIDCSQTNNHNNCEPFGSTKLSLENDDYISRPLNLSGFNSVDFSFDLETVANNDNDDIVTIKICTNTAESDCYTLYTNGNNNGNFAQSPINITANLSDPAYLTANVHLFFHIEGFSGSAEYVYINNITVQGRNEITNVVITTDPNSLANDEFYSTDNIETANFGTTGGNDSNNNFGISIGTRLENTTWLDLNANSLEDPLETGIANMGICISNELPLMLNGQNIPIGGYNDTVYTGVNGNYVFENLPDCDWQLVVHYDSSLYTPTYDADGGVLNSTTFSLVNGEVSAADNPWCQSTDCLEDLDFGFSLAGEFNLSGTICIDDGSKDGICNTGGETFFEPLDILLYDDEGNFYGGVTTTNSSYLFPFLLEDGYIVSLGTGQMSLDTFLFTTKEGATPAEEILETSSAILQKVVVAQEVSGVDFAFTPHSLNQISIVATDDEFVLCPGTKFENWAGANDTILNANFLYRILEEPQDGNIFMDELGTFTYSPVMYECGRDEFSYQVCDLQTSDCDTARVSLIFEDTKAPNLVNIPEDITISCEEYLPAPALVSAFDNCPRISIDLTENSTAGEDGCSQYHYEMTRTWTAMDLCGNTKSDVQQITVQDIVAPDIFRIYTLPNGKKMIAGIAEFTGERWKTVPFPIDFAAAPLVFTQIISNEDITPAVPQIRDISKAQFELHLKEEEANDGEHTRESVAWIAIEQGNQEESFDMVADILSVNHTITNIDFDNQFDATPAFFTTVQTINEKDPVVISTQNLTTNGSSVFLLEETSSDTETDHFMENVGYLAIENIGDITNENGEIIGEVGQTTVSSNPKTINLSHTYHNPVVITSIIENEDNRPQLISIDQLTPTSFAVQLQTWEYLGAISGDVEINYLVIEGSIPLYSPNFCDNGGRDLVIGEDIKAVDNCDNAVDLAYTEFKRFNGADQVTERNWRSTDECGNEVAYTQEVICEGIAVGIKTYLQGALLGSEEEGLMRDDLRKKELIPLIEPYSDLLSFQHAGSGGGEQLNPDLLLNSGKNALVDWVLIEIRSGDDLNELVATSAGLVQKDGDVVSASGDSLIVFENIPYGDYYVAVRHRNHIGMITKDPQTFGFNEVPQLDFRNIFTPTEGDRPAIKVGNRNAQWSGDLNGDGKTIYQGPNNDPFEMFLAVILDEGNRQYLVNYINRGYTQKDFNLDGTVIFQGPNNDRSNLLFNTILAHPDNDKFLANFIVVVGNTSTAGGEGDDDDDDDENENGGN